MRSESEVQARIRHLLSVELDRQIEAARARLPHKCRHNHRQALDVRKEIEGEPNPGYNRVTGALPVIGLCMLGADNPEQWNGTICEDPIDALRCPYYDSPSDTKATVEAAFYSRIRDLEWVRQNLPEVYGLLWALGSDTMPSLPWWKALWFKFISVRPDPLAPALMPVNPTED